MFWSRDWVESECPDLRMKRGPLYGDFPEKTVVQCKQPIRYSWRVQVPAIHKHSQTRPHARHGRQHGWCVIERIVDVGTDKCQDDGCKRFEVQAVGRTEAGAQ